MELEFQKQMEVPLLHRQRVTVLVAFDGGATPSVLELKGMIAKKLKVHEDLVAIRHVYQHYGISRAKVIAHIYKERDDLLRLEKVRKGERKEQEEKKKEIKKEGGA